MLRHDKSLHHLAALPPQVFDTHPGNGRRTTLLAQERRKLTEKPQVVQPDRLRLRDRLRPQARRNNKIFESLAIGGVIFICGLAVRFLVRAFL